MTGQELRDQAQVELQELGPEPRRRSGRRLWREERRGIAVLLAGLADWDAVLLRRAAMRSPGDVGRGTCALLLEAADIGGDEMVTEPDGPTPGGYTADL